MLALFLLFPFPLSILLFIIYLLVSLSLSLPPAPHLGGDRAEREQKPSGVQLNVCHILGADWPFLHLNATRNSRNVSLPEHQTGWPQTRPCWEQSHGIIRAHHSAWYLCHETPPDPHVSSRDLPLHHITDVTGREGAPRSIMHRGKSSAH